MVLEGKYIFILGLMKFDGEIESTNYTIARHLAKKNTVFYIDNPYTWRDYYKFQGTPDFERRKPHFGLFRSGVIDTDEPGLKVVITPPLASLNFLPEGWFYRASLGLNQRIIAGRIKRVIAKYQINEYIFINSYNFHYPDVGDYLKPVLKVYHCVDPLIPPFDTRHGIISERQLVSTSDVVICSSKQLYREKKALNPNTFFVPNAADVKHSQKALDPLLPVQPQIAAIPKPVIGYFGNIERRLDYNLIKEVAALNPDKSFMFAGPTSEKYVPEWFYSVKNIYFTGRLPYSELPAVLKGFDVALLPFKCDDVSRTIFPLKLFEYLGAGKPVVATMFNPDLKELTGDTVTYCETAVEFSAAIIAALNTDTPGKQQERQAVAAANTWERRGNEFSEILNNQLNK